MGPNNQVRGTEMWSFPGHQHPDIQSKFPGPQICSVPKTEGPFSPSSPEEGPGEPHTAGQRDLLSEPQEGCSTLQDQEQGPANRPLDTTCSAHSPEPHKALGADGCGPSPRPMAWPGRALQLCPVPPFTSTPGAQRAGQRWHGPGQVSAQTGPSHSQATPK